MLKKVAERTKYYGVQNKQAVTDSYILKKRIIPYEC